MDDVKPTEDVKPTKGKVEKAVQDASAAADKAISSTADAVRLSAEQVINETEKAAQSARKTAEKMVYQPEYDRTNVRTSGENRSTAFNPIAWVVDGATGVVEEVKNNDLGLSEEFWVHFNAMQREGLLALRAAIDSVLANTEKATQELKEQVERQTRRGEVKVTVE